MTAIVNKSIILLSSLSLVFLFTNICPSQLPLCIKQHTVYINIGTTSNWMLEPHFYLYHWGQACAQKKNCGMPKMSKTSYLGNPAYKSGAKTNISWLLKGNCKPGATGATRAQPLWDKQILVLKINLSMLCLEGDQMREIWSLSPLCWGTIQHLSVNTIHLWKGNESTEPMKFDLTSPVFWTIINGLHV